MLDRHAASCPLGRSVSARFREDIHRQMEAPYTKEGLRGWFKYNYDSSKLGGLFNGKGPEYFELPAYRAQAEFLAGFGNSTATSPIPGRRMLFYGAEPQIEKICAARPDLCARPPK